VKYRALIFSSLLACHSGTTSQPTATPKEPLPWGGMGSLQEGSVDSECSIGGISAIPERASWAYAGAQNVCLVRALSLPKSSLNDWALGPIDDCGSISEVGSVAYAAASKRLYVMGSLSVRKMIDENGAVSFDGGTANNVFQIDPSSPGALKVVDTTETLRKAILEEFLRWNQELEKSGLRIEQDKKSLSVGGLTQTPEGDFLLAFRAPRVCPTNEDKPSECRAILLLLSDLDEMFTTKDARPDIKARATISLDGGGIASLAYEPLSEGYLLTSTKEKTAFLLRYQGAFAAMKKLPIPIPEGGKFRAVLPAPDGAAAVFLNEKDAKCKLSWKPIPLELFDGVDRTQPPDPEEQANLQDR
jgi:hypothetical protein